MNPFMLIFMLFINVFVLGTLWVDICNVRGLRGGFGFGVWDEGSPGLRSALRERNNTIIMMIFILIMDYLVF
jgi:hypothetical protein